MNGNGKQGHGLVVVIGSKQRCVLCGHRIAVDGIAPTATREQPPSTWLPELRDRRRARLVGRWTREAA